MSVPPVFRAPGPFSGDAIDLPESEVKHARKVLRLREGDRAIAVDGCGVAREGSIEYRGNGAAIVGGSDIHGWGEPEVAVTLAAALSTNDKFDSVIQKGTELGVCSFQPLIGEKGKVRVDDPARLRARLSRYARVAEAAMKQSRRSVLPTLAHPMTLECFFAESRPTGPCLLFHPGQGSVALSDLTLPGRPDHVSLIVGPESGFSDNELALAHDHGCQFVSLGARILRTETASPVAVALVMHHLGQLR